MNTHIFIFTQSFFLIFVSLHPFDFCMCLLCHPSGVLKTVGSQLGFLCLPLVLISFSLSSHYHDEWAWLANVIFKVRNLELVLIPSSFLIALCNALAQQINSILWASSNPSFALWPHYYLDYSKRGLLNFPHFTDFLDFMTKMIF